MSARNATAAVIGAGDFIGAAIARKFAAEGFTTFVGRRNGDKLAPLIADIEKAGGKAIGRSLDARKEDDLTAFLQEAERAAPLEVCIFNIGANVNFPILETTERVFRKVWEMACYSGFIAGREAARLMRLRGVLRRKSRAADGRAVDGARARPEEYSCRTPRDRCWSRHRVRTRANPC